MTAEELLKQERARTKALEELVARLPEVEAADAREDAIRKRAEERNDMRFAEQIAAWKAQSDASNRIADALNRIADTLAKQRT